MGSNFWLERECIGAFSEKSHLLKYFSNARNEDVHTMYLILIALYWNNPLTVGNACFIPNERNSIFITIFKIIKYCFFCFDSLISFEMKVLSF